MDNDKRDYGFMLAALALGLLLLMGFIYFVLIGEVQ